MKVFISSTYTDLIDYRQAAKEAVLDLELTLLAMEHFLAVAKEPKEVCADKIRDCDVFVGIYAHRYGFIPDGDTESITQQEYELAKELKKPCLCFIVKDGFPWNPNFIESKPKIKKKLAAFLGEVKKEKTCADFTEVLDFKEKLSASLAKHIMEHSQSAPTLAAGGTEPGSPAIPKAPAPFIAHPYPLPKNFTGRIEEQDMLTQWLIDETQPVLVLEAIGGMGKTALTWVWLQKLVKERGQDIAGVFWWSFYESPFEAFIYKLACYVQGMEDRGETRMSVDMDNLQAVLHNGRYVLVLDGLERILAGYAGMNSAYKRDEGIRLGADEDTEGEKRQRVPVHPQAARFLTHLASPTGKTKILVTSRLMPLPLEGLEGVKHVFLNGLNPEDAANFLRHEGVSGSRSELEQAAKVYGNHPLMLKLLASAIKRSRSRDIRDADTKGLIDKMEPQKILTTMYNLLYEEERRVGSIMAVNRSIFKFELARALLPDMDEEKLWQVLMELCDLGFLFFDDRQDCFDFHPLLRSFLYDRLTNPEEVHHLAVQYFQTLPEPEKVVSLEDLAPVIELYRHLVKAGKYDEARVLFRDRISKPTYYQLSTYPLIIELLGELFPPRTEGEPSLPRLKDESAQGWTLNTLANAYTLSGQPLKAFSLFLQCAKIPEKNNNNNNLAAGLGNVASMAQIYIGRFSAGTGHLRKVITLCLETKNEFQEAIGHLELGRIMTYQGRVKKKDDASAVAKEELATAMDIFIKYDTSFKSVCTAYRSLNAVMQGRLSVLLPGQQNLPLSYLKGSLAQARQALIFAEETEKVQFPYPRDYIRAYWLLGETLAATLNLKHEAKVYPPFTIAFYDEYFQQKIETLNIAPGNELITSGRCLNEALRRCRKANMGDAEPSILISLARLETAKTFILPSNKIEAVLVALESLLEEAHEIALRAGYRLYLADIHLLAGQFLVEQKTYLKEKPTLLGLDAVTHLEKAKEFALDASEFSDLYKSTNPDFYKGIPEYEMLKRGMTEEERIRNGYYVAYRCAELLLSREDTGMDENLCS